MDMVPFPDPGGPMIAARNNLAMSSFTKQAASVPPLGCANVSFSCLSAREGSELPLDQTQQDPRRDDQTAPMFGQL